MRTKTSQGWSADELKINFNAGIGEIMYKMYRVIDIDTPLINGKLRKSFDLQNPYTYLKTGFEEGMYDPYYISENETPNYVSLTCAWYGSFQLGNTSCSYIWPYGTPTSVASTLQEVAVQVYPNPFDNTLNINADNGTASLYNSLGALVAQQPIKGKTAINTTQLAAGVYFLVLKDENGQLLHRQQVVK